MGADMTLYCVPACDLTPKRIKRVKQLVQALPADSDEFSQLMELLGYDNAGDAKQRLLKHCIDSQQPDRQIVTLYLPGCPYAVRAAGGLSWGDPPSEAYTTLEHVERCPQLWNLLESFAREDSLTTERKGSPGAAAMSGPRDITLVVTSEELGNEHFHYDSIPEALAAIERLVLAAEQQADGIERLIGIVVNPGELYGDPKRAESSASS